MPKRCILHASNHERAHFLVQEPPSKSKWSQEKLFTHVQSPLHMSKLELHNPQFVALCPPQLTAEPVGVQTPVPPTIPGGNLGMMHS